MCVCLCVWNVLIQITKYKTQTAVEMNSACLVLLTWIVFVMGGKWPYSCCLQDLFNTALSILVLLPSSFLPWERYKFLLSTPSDGLDSATTILL